MILALKIKEVQGFSSDFRYDIVEELSGQSLDFRQNIMKFQHNLERNLQKCRLKMCEKSTKTRDENVLNKFESLRSERCKGMQIML